MATVNEAVLEDAPGDQFCTLAWAALRRDDGAVVGEVACAGHPQPFLVRAAGGVESVAATGTLLGFFHDLRSSPAQLRLGPGDALVLFTDGVTEARLPDGSLFGAERVRDALATAADRTADGLLDALEAALDASRAEARDDVAIVVGRVSA
jgi:serine phosphatase RsbU (regulator of sigma subunit)